MRINNDGLLTNAVGRVVFAFLFSALIAFAAPLAQAGTLEVFFSEFDATLTPDPAGGTSTLTDAFPALGSPDSLLSATFAIDGTEVGTSTVGVTADMLVAGVPALSHATTVFSPPGGSFDLDFGGGKFLSLDLGDVAITYIDATAVQFVFGASIASGFTQDLPHGLGPDALKAPVTLSFSTQVKPGSIVSGAAPGDIIGFEAVGTGEIRGSTEIPEPSTVGLIALAGLMGGVVALRKRLG
ncbi:MAG: PEP-CTERM sorting domain-containing protein [Aeoliella sp.]